MMTIQIDIGLAPMQRIWVDRGGQDMASVLQTRLSELKSLARAEHGLVLRTTSLRARARAQLSAVASTTSAIGSLNAERVIAGLGETLLAHMERSSAPLVWTATQQPSRHYKLLSQMTHAVQPACAATAAVGPEGMALPVKLGGLGNGIVILAGPQLRLGGEEMFELHRKCFAMLKEILEIDLRKAAPRQNLNDRELECLQFAGEGLKSELIAERMQLSVHTVNAYLGSATAKLDSVNRIQAIAKAIRLGFLA
jgi:DNA-binding CsgD family transcriptional regulator